MPFGYPNLPGLSIALLKSILDNQGLDCDLYYGNLLFSRVTEADVFFEKQIAKSSVAEMAFVPYYFPTTKDQAAQVIHSHYSQLANTAETRAPSPYVNLVSTAGKFLDTLFDSIQWDNYDIVGFSLMFQQTLASLALAKRIKERHPGITIIFGGASCSAPMGPQMMRSFPEPDFIAMGEADETIGPLVRQIRAGKTGQIDLPGVVYRDGEHVKQAAPVRPVQDLDKLPTPDFKPYFEQLESLGLEHFRPIILAETSRGCWWGEKNKCLFCAVDPKTVVFRSKSPDRIVDEILTLSRRHHSTSFGFVDNIMNRGFYEALLPKLKLLREQDGFDFAFFFELKSNFRREQVQALFEAGIIKAEPGIESLNDNILRMLRKGATAIKQIQALKYLAEFDISVLWNIIYRLPNETADDYRQMSALTPYVSHLQPIDEGNMPPMLLQRYSPYFESPASFGISNIRPKGFYSDLFPNVKGVEQLAYFFDYSHDNHQNEDLVQAHGEFSHALAEWRSAFTPDALVQRPGPGFIKIFDRRQNSTEGPKEDITTISGIEAEIFSFCASAKNKITIMNKFSLALPAEKIQSFLDKMVRKKFMYKSATDQYLNLPLLKNQIFRSIGKPATDV